MEIKKDPRKDYRKRSSQFFLIGLVIALSLTLVAFEWKTFDEIIYNLPSPVDYLNLEDEEPPIRIVEKATPPAPKPPIKMPVPPQPDPVPDPIAPITPIPDPGVKPDPKNVAFEPEPYVSEVVPLVKFAEQMPEFIGGEPALQEYLGKNLKYPKIALEYNEEAKLYVQFIVNTDGSISDVEVLRHEGFGFDEEAIRVISQMPNWNPGMQGGRMVRVIYVIPINFAIK